LFSAAVPNYLPLSGPIFAGGQAWFIINLSFPPSLIQSLPCGTPKEIDPKLNQWGVPGIIILYPLVMTNIAIENDYL
jgi:hypothetical protein